MRMSTIEKIANKAINTWNTKHDDVVDVLVTQDDGSTVKTQTTSKAYLMCGSAMVMLKGLGAYDLERVKAI